MVGQSDPRVGTLTEAALAMEAGHFDVEIPAGDDDHVGTLGVAISRLGNALEHKYEELRALRVVAEEVGSSLLIEEVCEHVYDAFAELIPYHRMGLALLEDTRAAVRAVWARHDGVALRITRGYSSRLQGSSLEQILETGAPRILNDLPAYLQTHPRSESTRLMVDEGIQSSLTCPLVSQGRPVGFLFFSSRDLRAYEKPHIDLFLQIAASLSAVIDKSRLYEDLLALHSLKNRLLGMAAHDMRNPLTIIDGWVHMLRDGHAGELPEEALTALGHIENAASQVLRLVEDLLDVSVIESGRLELDRHPIDLVELLSAYLGSARLLASGKDVAIVAKLAPGPAQVLADPNRVRQLLDNLISNAVKFSARGTRVVVGLARRDGMWAISVADQGPGIPEADLPSLFGAFEQAAARPTAGERSIGLGLAIARRVVEAHSGRIGVESEMGVGSTFTIELPATDGGF